MSKNVLQEGEAGRVDPLQIVQEEHERVFLLREHSDEVMKHNAESILCLGRWQSRNGSLRANDKLYRWNHVHDQLAVDSQHRTKLVSPIRDSLFALGQNLEDQFCKSLN